MMKWRYIYYVESHIDMNLNSILKNAATNTKQFLLIKWKMKYMARLCVHRVYQIVFDLKLILINQIAVMTTILNMFFLLRKCNQRYYLKGFPRDKLCQKSTLRGF